MADLPPDSNEVTGEKAGAVPALNRRPPMPRWVKVFLIVGIIVLVLALGILIANFAGFGGEHGPGRHSQGAGDPTASDGNPAPPSAHHALSWEDHDDRGAAGAPREAGGTIGYQPSSFHGPTAQGVLEVVFR